MEILQRLQKECLPLDKLYDVNDGYWWMVYSGKTPIGFAALTASAQWKETGYLCRAGVVELFQGKGIQRKLIRAREQYARSLGWTHLVSDTHQNPASGNNLARCGYKMYDPASPWAFKDSLYWIKKL